MQDPSMIRPNLQGIAGKIMTSFFSMLLVLNKLLYFSLINPPPPKKKKKKKKNNNNKITHYWSSLMVLLTDLSLLLSSRLEPAMTYCLSYLCPSPRANVIIARTFLAHANSPRIERFRALSYPVYRGAGSTPVHSICPNIFTSLSSYFVGLELDLGLWWIFLNY